jgi:hypothetical protein
MILVNSNADQGWVSRRRSMAAENRQRITIETERILVVARQHGSRGWCERCGREVDLLTSEQACRLLEVTPEMIDRSGHGKLHLERAKDGLVICLKSLLKFLKVVSDK